MYFRNSDLMEQLLHHSFINNSKNTFTVKRTKTVQVIISQQLIRCQKCWHGFIYMFTMHQPNEYVKKICRQFSLFWTNTQIVKMVAVAEQCFNAGQRLWRWPALKHCSANVLGLQSGETFHWNWTMGPAAPGVACGISQSRTPDASSEHS